MSATSCGVIPVDPFDIELDCCLDIDAPVRPSETAEANVTVTNNEEVGVAGDLRYELLDANTKEFVAEVDTDAFSLESGESDGFEIEFTPESLGLGDKEANYTVYISVEGAEALQDENPDA